MSNHLKVGTKVKFSINGKYEGRGVVTRSDKLGMIIQPDVPLPAGAKLENITPVEEGPKK